MALVAEDFKKIREYISEELPRILEEKGLSILEFKKRIVRIEEELKAQRDLIIKGFELIEKRFEQMDRRFERIDKRFELIEKRFEQVDKRSKEISRKIFHFMIWSFGFTVTVAAIVIAVLK